MKNKLFLAIASCLLVSSAASAHGRSHLRSGRVKVMTQNLYIGVDVFRLVGVPFEDIPFAAAELMALVEQSNPPERMESVAREIARRRPHLIGLQEVYRIQTQTPGDFMSGNPTPAEDDLYEFLELLLAALEARGLDYRVAAEVANVDVELPAVAIGPDGPTLIDVRVRDRDVILARADVELANGSSGNFPSFPVLPIGPGLPSLRGFARVDAWIRGRKFHVVNTHLEVESPPSEPNYQAEQAADLIDILSGVEDPVIVLGDFNSGPQQLGVDTPYQQFAAAGYIDAWTARRGRRKPGYTCCQDEFLRNTSSTLDQRIDLIWVRNAHGIGPIRARTTGDKPRDRTPSGLWPSDHAGVAAWMRVR